jgi:glycosyltransferase involved in cell wall biosynthesis
MHNVIDPSKIFVTGNGVDIDMYKFCEEKENSIVVLGALLPHKRVDMAIRIFKTVRDRVKNLKLYVIGDGPEREISQNCR